VSLLFNSLSKQITVNCWWKCAVGPRARKRIRGSDTVDIENRLESLITRVGEKVCNELNLFVLCFFTETYYSYYFLGYCTISGCLCCAIQVLRLKISRLSMLVIINLVITLELLNFYSSFCLHFADCLFVCLIVSLRIDSLVLDLTESWPWSVCI